MKKNLLLLFLLFFTAVFAQQKQVVTSIDTLKNKIGAEFLVSYKTKVKEGVKVVFPKLKNLGALEVVTSYKVDTVKNNGNFELIKKYGITQFDSGRYVLPSIRILINNQAFATDSMVVEVANVAVDTLKQKMYDIKDIMPAESASSSWWKYLLAFLALATVGFGIFYYLKNKKKTVPEEVFKTPIEKATNLLNSLEKKQLWQKGEVKEYYSELTDIARNYIEEAIEIPAMESTTAELMLGLKKASQKKKMKVSKEIIENLERVLQQADLVKFAKSIPQEHEIAEDRNKIQKAILTLDNAIPTNVAAEEEMLLNEAQRQKQLALLAEKKRKTRIKIAITTAAGVIFGIFMVFVVTKGFRYTIDSILGKETKELLEGEWVKSEYGNPGILLETPKVLKRTDVSKLLPKNGLAVVKEMQSFTHGDLADDFYIMVSSLTFKQDTTSIDLNKTLEVSLQTLESQGAKNMLVKQEEFQNLQGIKGVKGHGTFARLNEITKTSEKLYYEILLFGQAGGLQQIMIFYKEGDTYANKIADRLVNSVELNRNN